MQENCVLPLCLVHAIEGELAGGGADRLGGETRLAVRRGAPTGAKTSAPTPSHRAPKTGTPACPPSFDCVVRGPAEECERKLNDDERKPISFSYKGSCVTYES